MEDFSTETIKCQREVRIKEWCDSDGKILGTGYPVVTNIAVNLIAFITIK